MGKHHFRDETHRDSARNALDESSIDQLAVIRAGSDDLQQPEMEALRTALATDSRVHESLGFIQNFDRTIRAAMDDVPVPEGLAERLITSLSITSVAADATVEDPVVPAAATGASPSFRPRRLIWAMGIAGSLLIAVFAASRLLGPAITPNEIPTLAVEWQGELPDQWSTDRLPRQFTLPSALKHLAQDWQRRTIKGQQAIAVRLLQGSTKATLFIVDYQIDALPNRVPRTPQLETAGRAFAYWQERGKLNVLLVQGGKREYLRIVGQESGALALVIPLATPRPTAA